MVDDFFRLGRTAPREYPHGDSRGWIVVAAAQQRAIGAEHFDRRAGLEPNRFDALDRLRKDPWTAAAHGPLTALLENDPSGRHRSLGMRGVHAPEVIAMKILKSSVYQSGGLLGSPGRP